MNAPRLGAFALGCAAGLGIAALAVVMAWLPAAFPAALAGLLTPLIAIMGVYIAHQQAQTSRQKLEFDRYDRRREIYGQLSAFLGIVAREGAAKTAEAVEFKRSVSDADFLFGRDRSIPEYLDEVFRRAVHLASLGRSRQGAADRGDQAFDYEKNATDTDAELSWFMAQFEIAREKFGAYLTMR